MIPLERIDRYEIREMLGRGAMGCVYEAWDPKLHRTVALKVVSQDLAHDPKTRERFHREARAIAALRHPNIVEIYDYSGEDSEHLYLVMERLDGGDVFNIMNDKGPMPEPAAAAVGHELCLALQVAHDHGIIHRDLKPENVFLNAAGRIVLTDFGVVKAVREDSAVDGFAQKTDVIGTPGFMAPEVMMSRSLGPRTDIYALGALLYNIATGEMPYNESNPIDLFRAVVAGKYVEARKYNRLLSDEFCAALDGCLRPKPKKRFRSAEQLREALKAVLELNGVSDLRDDLRDYMRDPSAYGAMARRRAADRLLQRLKVAVKDKDEQLANQLRQRLLVVDPENAAVAAISSFMSDTDGAIILRTDTHGRAGTGQDGQLAGRGSRSGRSGAEPTPRWIYLLGGIIAGVAIILSGYMLLRGQRVDAEPGPGIAGTGTAVTGTETIGTETTSAETTSAETRPEVEPERVAPARRGKLLVSLESGGVLYVDGKRLGKIRRKALALDAGTHVVEVRRRGSKRLKRTVQVPEAGSVTVSVDARRGKVSVE